MTLLLFLSSFYSSKHYVPPLYDCLRTWLTYLASLLSVRHQYFSACSKPTLFDSLVAAKEGHQVPPSKMVGIFSIAPNYLGTLFVLPEH